MKLFDITYHFIDGKSLTFEEVEASNQVNALDELESKAVMRYASVYHKNKSYYIKEENVTYIEIEEIQTV